MSDVRGKAASVVAKLPPWKAEAIALDIENMLSFIQSVPREWMPKSYPLALHDFAKELRDGLKDAEGEQ